MSVKRMRLCLGTRIGIPVLVEKEACLPHGWQNLFQEHVRFEGEKVSLRNSFSFLPEASLRLSALLSQFEVTSAVLSMMVCAKEIPGSHW